MDVYIDYETVCVNCKEKGYSFGYTFKTIEYLGITVLDIPTRYLNGPCISFKYREVPILIRSLENSHKIGELTNKPLFTMINAKRNNDSTICRFTYLFSPQLHPKVQLLNLNPPSPPPKILEYVDIYRYDDKPYILMFYSFRNSTKSPLIDFKFYNFYDFDIKGQEFYNSDLAKYDPSIQMIYQYDSQVDLQSSIFAGLGSVKEKSPDRFESNHPQEIMITRDRLNLRNQKEFGPEDCAVALQWNIPQLGPGQLEIFPMMLVFGKGKEQFYQNIKEARRHLEKLVPSIYNAVNGKFRQLIDPQLEKMSFSQREWCKD